MRKPRYFRRFDYDRRLLPVRALRKLEKGATQETVVARTGYSIGYPGWNLIYFLIQCQFESGSDGIIIETGTNRGATAAVLAQGLVDADVRNPRVVSFELDEHNAVAASEFITKCRLNSVVEIFTGDSRQTLAPALNDSVKEESVRLAFLDASHFAQDVRYEFEAVLPYLTHDALVVFDNTYPIAEGSDEPRVAQFLDQLVSEFGGSLIELPFVSWFTPGVAIWQRNRPNWAHLIGSNF